MMADTGCTDLMCTGYFPSGVESDDWGEIIDPVIRKTFNVLKVYKNNDTSFAGYDVIPLRGSTVIADYFSVGYRFFTADGVLVRIDNGGCAPTAHPNESKFKNTCAGFTIDINGTNPPNQRGKDVFGDLRVAQDGTIYPATSLEWVKSTAGVAAAKTHRSYWRNSVQQCAKDGKANDYDDVSGQNCMARIMDEGWKINYL